MFRGTVFPFYKEVCPDNSWNILYYTFMIATPLSWSEPREFFVLEFYEFSALCPLIFSRVYSYKNTPVRSVLRIHPHFPSKMQLTLLTTIME